MDLPPDQTLAARLKDESLRPFLGSFDWEPHLSDEQLELLATYHSIAAEDDRDGDTFAKNYATSAHRELLQDLAEAQTDAERAQLYFEAELECYPFRITNITLL